MRKKINLDDIVVYNQKKRRTRRDIDEVAKKIDEHRAEVNQLKDTYGLGKSYSADNNYQLLLTPFT